MTARVQRDVTDLIRRGGGTEVKFEAGGRHTKVIFRDCSGVEQRLTMHLGGRPNL